MVSALLVGVALDPWADFPARLEALRVEGKLPGVAAAFVRPEGEPQIFVAGVRKYGENDAVQPTDRWHLGSCTKSMTGMILATLVAEGKLKWDMTLAEAFPSAKIDPAFRPVTLRQVLSMEAGFEPNAANWWSFQREEPDLRKQRMLAVAEALDKPGPKAKVGAFTYSNVSFVVAGALAERTLNQPYERIFLDRVAKPLGLKSAGFGPTGEGQPWPHIGTKPQAANETLDNASAMTAAGRAHMSMRDWSRYAQSVLRAMRGESSPWPKTFRDEILAAQGKRGYALGWGIGERPWAKGLVLTHGGSNTMNTCTVWIAPETGHAFLVATNTAGGTTSKTLDTLIGELIQRANR